MKNKYYATICAISKDENDIEDWVNYHFSIGFDRIVIFDNNSKVSIKKVLKGYIKHGIVVVEDIDLNEFPQLSAYATFLKYFGPSTRWAAFIDIDEYINIKKEYDIADFLDKYLAYAAIGINWKIFGSNGHITRPKNKVIESYTSCLHSHSLIKSIVQPEMVSRVMSPHHFEFKNSYCVNEHFIPILGPRSYPTTEEVQINHYYFKSQQDFEQKINRGFATPVKGRDGYKMKEFYNQSNKTCESEESILRFSEKMTLYSINGPEYIAKEIHSRINVNTKEIINTVANSILHERESDVIKRVRQALRYSRDPLLCIALAKIYIHNCDYKEAFRCLTDGFVMAGDNFEQRKHLFEELAILYKKAGYTSQQLHIQRELSNSN